ncbi:MAG: hypothetical protein JW987_00415 [Anaerolineaceae bacterium]|nr:hypothetical protein [Anaerolineaceae bacterium]
MNDETPSEKPLLPETNPEATPADEPVESSMELAPGWWEVLLDELGRLPEEEVAPSHLEQMMAAEEEPQFDIEEELGSFAFDEEQFPESLWDLAPGLRTIADNEPRPTLPPKADEEPAHILPPAEDFRPVDFIPEEPKSLPEAGPALEPGTEFSEEDIRSIWEVVPSWWKVYTAEDFVRAVGREDLLEEEPPEELADDWVTAVPQLSDYPEPDEAESLWDYAPELKDHLTTGDDEPRALPVGEDGIARWSLEEGEQEGENLPELPYPSAGTESPALLSDAFYPEDEADLQSEELDLSQLPPAAEEEFPTDDETPAESVWEAVPSWWQVYAANIEEERDEEDEERLSYFDYESLDEEEGPLPIPLDDEDRINLSEELVKYIEETQERIEADALAADAEEGLEELPVVAQPAFKPDIEIPEELQEELEKEEGARPRYATLPFVLASAAAVVVVVLLMWLGGGALARALSRQPAIDISPVTQATASVLYPNTIEELQAGPYDVIAKPVGLELKTGVVFSLQEGQLEQGRWEPKSAEWLPGADLVKIVAIPWKDDYQTLVDSLQVGEIARLAMSNWIVEQYQIREIFLAPRTRTDFLNDRKLSLVVIFSRGDDADRWVILLDRTQ